jgi:segregation and condensation protein B
MDYFGINSTDDLPKIKEVLAEQSIQGTLINDAANNHVDRDAEVESVPNEEEAAPAQENPEAANTTLIVADNGQLIEQPLDADEEVSADNNAPEEINPASEDTSSEDTSSEDSSSEDKSEDTSSEDLLSGDKSGDDKPGDSSQDIKRED